jgi:RNA polymerase sigma factor (sigma-70 family)
MRARSNTLIQDLGALYGAGVLGGLADSQLLERFNATGNEADRAQSELAFAALVERYGPMVWHVCMSFLGQTHDAEDAFQATFLVLVRKAGSLRLRGTLGPWLYAVACRTGLNARSAAARRRAVEQAAAKFIVTDRQAKVATGSELDELGPLLHREVMRLPERLRAAVVLCDLEGLSYRQAAARLELPLGTLQSRLARARRRLRCRLTWHSAVMPPSATRLDLAGAPISDLVARTRPPLDVVQRLRASRTLLANGSTTLSLSKLNAIAASLLTAAVLGGVILAANQIAAGPRHDEPRPSAQSQSATQPDLQNGLLIGAKPQLAPAPAELNVTAGRGKVLLYTLDRDRNRIPDHPRNAWKEAAREVHWAVVTGVVDHRAIHTRFSTVGLFMPPPVEEIYKRVELQRQSPQSNGGWSDWQEVNSAPTLQILDNLPEEQAERTPDEVRCPALVDPLPFLTEGVWSGVDVERFIPTSREKTARGLRLPDELGKRSPGLLGPVEKLNRARPPVLMVRAFDFSVQAGRKYRYRVRLVLLAPGPKNLAGLRKGPSDFPSPWSERTNTVLVP